MAAAVIAALLVCGGCATTPKPDRLAVRTMIHEISNANPYHATMKMSGRAEILTDGVWVKSKAALIVSRPDSMRVTLFEPTGTAWFVGIANAQYLGFAVPAENVYKVLRKGKGVNIRIGRLKFQPDDFLRFIQPGLELEWLEKSHVTITQSGLRVVRKYIVYNLELDGRQRLKSVLIKRPDIGPVRYSYEYLESGGYTVEMDGKIRFEITRMVKNAHLPDSLFDPRLLRM
ncbi:MAG: hypothetical protein IEMM0002_0285 [bacterium]|nr:MAG: hypothetical protein IEMM0002_0285 [bacterium]